MPRCKWWNVDDFSRRNAIVNFLFVNFLRVPPSQVICLLANDIVNILCLPDTAQHFSLHLCMFKTFSSGLPLECFSEAKASPIVMASTGLAYMC